ncbi:MAG: glycosyl transferase family 2 [Bacteroidetes bacterium]|jgi:GT2 family glycosyltransferase|nr:glycosyl transferase family 2 [Bacteroidota bacterium]
MFDIAVILINYNSSEHSINCINSIIQQTSNKVNYQIIVVDNCSEKEDFIQLKSFCCEKNIANLQLYRSNINTGFGGGNMFGVQHADAEYLAFVNNDTLFYNDCLSILRDAIKNNPEIGLVGGQSFKPGGKPIISFDHYTTVRKQLLGGRMLEITNKKRYPKRKKIYTRPITVEFIAGSFMFLRTSDLNDIGGFDTSIFLYYEETDLCKRLKAIGKSAVLVPEARYMHIHGASTPHTLATKKELKISLLYVIRKHSGYLPYLFLRFYFTVRYFFSSIVRPKYWSLFYLFLIGAPLSKSLKQKQKIKTF